ncbi:hypothetical protein STCU_06014 [Strigomonas culicis]|uniref:Rieske domain-containing protein n=1 Tax=Strigomonas culicis TaxID=28005 RepID=S9VIH4_9TRYP|nr:hypothetical protein STCU_06014 [Strigomonas culicis]|eukprot:EPY26916.1 hypothetical protein STCU_06014 [Strigomonas culicis]
MSSNKTGGNVQRIHVGARTLFTPGARQLVKVGMRNIAVVEHKGHLYAIDNACYHHGGPLLNGDIEDMGGHPCIVCPWHSYRIALDTGEGLYVGIDVVPGAAKPVPAVRSKGCKQRVHQVVCDGGEVYVLVDLSGPAIESDSYANMALANQEGAMAAPRESGGRRPLGLHSGMRSGQVLQHTAPSRAGTSNPFSTAPPLLVASGDRRHCSPVPELTVSCCRILPVSEGVKEFYFHRADGTLMRLGQPGEYIELELPPQGRRRRPPAPQVDDLRGQQEGRALHAAHQGAHGEPRGASTWMHNYALHSSLHVCQVNGHLTHAHHARRLHELQGRVLWLTAGIGISCAFAALNQSFNEDLAVMPSQARGALHALHLHTDCAVAAVAKLPDLLDLQRRYADPTAAHTYQLHCYITQGQAAAAATQTYVTSGRRITAADIAQRTRSFFGDGVRFLSFVCGPPPS